MFKILKKGIFFVMFVLVLFCAGCTAKQEGNSEKTSQTMEETENGKTEETPADIYEFQEEEE